MSRFFSLVLVFAGACSLVACSTTSGGSVAGSPVPALVQPVGPSPKEALDAERARLAELFKGTPVLFVTTSEGNMRATVPRRYCFDTGSAVVKAPLAAVLDRVAKSQRDTASSIRIAAPADPGARGAAVAQERATSLRDHMVGQGISAARLQSTGSASTEQVELFVVPVPAA